MEEHEELKDMVLESLGRTQADEGDFQGDL
jgi:hypothetical protein